VTGVEGREVDSEVLELWQYANICRTFPAYRLEDMATAPVGDLMRVMQLISTNDKIQVAMQGGSDG
jgi:hypothetical protein